MKWRVSAAWLTKQHDCTPTGIAERCHGGCCYSTRWWPPAAYGNPDGRCGYLGEAGCVLAPDDKPVKCHLYPLLVRRDLLQQHFRVTCSARGMCKGNHGRGPILIDAIRDSLVHLFGQEQYDKLREDVTNGRDGVVEVPEDVYAAYLAECEEEATMSQFPPRSERVQP